MRLLRPLNRAGDDKDNAGELNLWTEHLNN
jgi:hypothetical protein